MSTQCKHLLSPLKMGTTTVKNRVVFSSHETHFGYTDDKDDGETYIRYVEERAKGGCGFIVTSAITIHPSASYWGIKSPTPEILIPKLRDLAGRAHKYGTKVVAQLYHGGREMFSDASLLPQKAFSPIPSPAFEETPYEMTAEEVEEIIDCYVRYARVVQESGYDGIELHGTHGFLIQQSWSPWANQRTDEYGPGLNFITELLNRIRETVGQDFLVGIRISADDLIPGGLDTGKMTEVAKYLESTGKIDFIDTSAGGSFGHYSYTIGPNYVPLGAFVPLVAKIKASLKTVPIFAAIRINDPLQAEAILENGYADMIVMTRAQLADPELVNKTMEGRIDDIRHCIGCLQGCFSRIATGKELTCLQNPVVGREKQYASLSKIARKARLAVVGGGPAGLEAARVGAERGFEVVLFEKEQELGGQIRLMCKSIPEREEFNEIVRWRKKQIESLGVEVRTGVAADIATIKEARAEHVIIATGALSRTHEASGCDAENVFTDIDWVSTGKEIGDKVLIVDRIGNPKGVVIADHLSKKDKKVTFVTKWFSPGVFAGITQVLFLYPGLYKRGTVFIPDSDLASVTDGEAHIVNLYSNQTSKLGRFDTILTITAPKANDRLYRELLSNNIKCIAVGDAAAPRDAQMAIRDAFDAVAALEA